MNLTDKKYSKFALVREMMDAPTPPCLFSGPLSVGSFFSATG